nr:fibroleukin-like [Drosophila takahashii]
MISRLAFLLSVFLINELSIIGANPDNFEIKNVVVMNINHQPTANQDNQIRDQNEELKNQIKNITQLLKNTDEKVSFMSTSIGNLQRNLEIARNEIQNKETQINDITKKLSNQISELKDDLFKCQPRSSCPVEGPNGIYNITVGDIHAFEAPCNSTGWLTIQKRFDGSENFDRTWKDYKDGFGNIEGEFFIGLERLHIMTQAQPHELRIELGMVNGSTSYAHYDDFKIGSEEELYELESLGIYNGTAGDSLKDHNEKKFTTHDRDNDESKRNCATKEWGGWWYTSCARR